MTRTSLEGMLKVTTDELMAKLDEIEALMTTLGDADNPDADSVRGKLAAAVAEVERLTAEIGTAEDPNSLMGMLAAEQAKVAAANTRIAALVAGKDPDQLTGPRGMAKVASDAAAAAETAAGDAADEAETAKANRATMQTGTADSTVDADAARDCGHDGNGRGRQGACCLQRSGGGGQC